MLISFMASDESFNTSKTQFSQSKKQGYQVKDSTTSHLALPFYFSTDVSWVAGIIMNVLPLRIAYTEKQLEK